MWLIIKRASLMLKSFNSYKDNKCIETTYYVNKFYNYSIIIATPNIKLCCVFKQKSNPYSELYATFPMTCTVCDSDINVNVEVNNDAAYVCNYSYKHKLLPWYLIIDYNTTNIIVIGKISETHSVNS